MARPDINRSGEIEVFVRVVEAGSFSAAARALRMTPSAVSKLIARLEARLGARLVSRSTRKLQLTPEGTAFYDSGVRILADMAAAEREAAVGAAPRGRLRVNSYVPFGVHRLIPLLPRFLERYPEISVDLVLTDSVIDLMQERADVAVRAGPLGESRLVARKLGQCRMTVVAAPSYLKKHGRPSNPSELAVHRCIQFRDPLSGRPFPWEFHRRRKIVPVRTRGTLLVNDSATMIAACLAGAGVAQVLALRIHDLIESGQLIELFPDWPGETFPLYAFYPSRRHLPAKVRAFIDFCVEAAA